MKDKDIIKYVLEKTEILRMPSQKLSTFGTTNITYFLLSSLEGITRLRKGKVVSKRPEIIQPPKIDQLFEGFGEDSEKYAREIYEQFGENPKILNYQFKNTTSSTSEISQSVEEVYDKILKQIKEKDNNLYAIIKTEDKIWQISMMKFIVDLTLESAEGNIADLKNRGMFTDSAGIPENVRNKIQYLFKEAENNREKMKELGKLLNKYDLFEEYEDRFFGLMDK
ncbi:MAG: hypothetical protein ACQEQC_08950 [Elusimicrobiota bacterium]